MKRTFLIFVDLVFATIVAILGNIIANYLQEQWNLTESTRIGSVVIIFIVCFVLLLFVTLKRSKSEENGDGTKKPSIRVKQDMDDVQKGGKATGVETDIIEQPISIDVEQKARKVSGAMTGIKIGRLGNSDKEQNE